MGVLEPDTRELMPMGETLLRMKRKPPRGAVLGVSALLLVVLSGRAEALRAQSPPIRAGVAVVDITPPLGARQYRGVGTAVHDPLHAKALVFRQGDRSAALVMADLIAITPGLAMEARSLASARTGIPFSNIIVAATHSHTGPEYRDEMEQFVERKRAGKLTAEEEGSYPAELIRELAQAVIDADRSLRPVQLRTGAGEAHGISFNRRFFLKNGRVRMNPCAGNPDIVRPAGPIDPEVGILMLAPADGGAPFASLTVFANHLDTVGDTQFSADYPHYLSEGLRQSFGRDFVSLFGLGTAGDINHIDVKAEPGRREHRMLTRRIGETLGRVVTQEAGRLQRVERPSLEMRSTYVYAPMQEYTAEELAWARSEGSAPLYEEREALQMFRRRKILALERLRRSGAAVPPTVGGEGWRLPLEVQVMRLGEEEAIVGLPGEVFVELGLAIKRASPFARTLVIELTNNNIAYVPTREGFAQGDYEAIASRVAPGGGEMLVEAAVRLLRELKPDASAGPVTDRAR